MDKKRILIVDDDQLVRDLIASIFNDKYIVDSVSDGKALYELGSINYDLIISDLIMPGFMGDESISLIKAFGNQSSILIITGDQSYTNDRYEVLYKPFDINELVKKAEILLKRS